MLFARLKTAPSTGLAPTSTVDFDAKFEYLKANNPGRIDAFSRIEKHLRGAWARALYLEQELANAAPMHHEALERARQQASYTADLRSMENLAPTSLLETMRDEIKDQLTLEFKDRLGVLAVDVADGEVARLIGAGWMQS